MQLIELTIEKELDVQRLNDIRDTIDNITKKWEALNVYVISLMEKCALFGEPLLEIEKVRERTDQITNKLGEIDESVNILDFSTLPIAVLYFLIRQQRSLCEIEENIKACDLMQKVKYRIWESPHRDTTMKELYYCGMPLNEVEDFIDMETELLAVCIYGGE